MLLEEESFSINVLSLKGGVRDSLEHTLQAITGLRRSSGCESQPETEPLVSMPQAKWRTKTGLKHLQGFPQNEVTAFHCIKLLLNKPRPGYWAMMEREADDWEAQENQWVRGKSWALPTASSGFQGTTLMKQRSGRARRSPKATSKILSTCTTNPQHKFSFLLTLSIEFNKATHPLLSGQWKEYEFRNIIFMRHKHDRKTA